MQLQFEFQVCRYHWHLHDSHTSRCYSNTWTMRVKFQTYLHVVEVKYMYVWGGMSGQCVKPLPLSTVAPGSILGY